MFRGLRFPVAVMVTVGLTAAACGGSGGSAPAVEENQGQGNSSGGEEFGLTEEEIAVRIETVESLIAECMNGAGFDYVPVDYGTTRIAMDADSKPGGVTNEEFRAQYGYGITTLFTAPATQASLGLGSRNVEIRDGLSSVDQLAWERALFGGEPNQTFVVALDEEDLSMVGGCTLGAVGQVFPDELSALPGVVDFEDPLDARVDEDPRIVEAYRNWAVCMRDGGFDYDNPDDIKTDLATGLDAIVGEDDPTTLGPDADAALTALQGEERALAAADDACDLEFVDAIKTEVENEIFGPGANEN